jgi:hypothetical protein
MLVFRPASLSHQWIVCQKTVWVNSLAIGSLIRSPVRIIINLSPVSCFSCNHCPLGMKGRSPLDPKAMRGKSYYFLVTDIEFISNTVIVHSMFSLLHITQRRLEYESLQLTSNLQVKGTNSNFFDSLSLSLYSEDLSPSFIISREKHNASKCVRQVSKIEEYTKKREQ